MRLKFRTRIYGYLTAILIATNFIVLMTVFKMDDSKCNDLEKEHSKLTVNGNFMQSDLWSDVEASSHKVTVLVRQFEMFSHNLNETIGAICKELPQTPVFIISDDILYPPMQFASKNVKVAQINLRPDYKNQLHASKLMQYITTEYVLLVPDGAKIFESEIEKLMRHTHTYPKDIIAARVMGETLKCFAIGVSFRNWTVSYKEMKKSLDIQHQHCDGISGVSILLIPKKLLFSLSHPFFLPMPLSIFIQTAHRGLKVMLANDVIFRSVKKDPRDPHLLWKMNELNKLRLKALYQEFGIKKVVQVDGSVEWHGCSKQSSRCFGTIINSLPSYLYEGRWTPPCCLEALRITARHVFSVLNECGVKYWLEGGSLLGAVRYGDIIPWDYDVDIGIYKNEIKNCIWLNQIDNTQNKPLMDDSGFIWERATEGDFYRVQYSLKNHLHVDIFPFYERNGIMTKDTWFKTHKQDREFPQKFLQPLSAISFVGVMASAPNNIRDFLEFKFGKGVIENPIDPVQQIFNATYKV